MTGNEGPTEAAKHLAAGTGNPVEEFTYDGPVPELDDLRWMSVSGDEQITASGDD